MPDIFCNFQVSGCDCPEQSPFKNLSAEAPDLPAFIGTYYGKEIPPLGFEYARFTCTGVCISTTSQQDADLCARRQAFDCIVDTWASDGGGPSGAPVPPPQNPIGRNRFFSTPSGPATGTATCPDGLVFTFQVPAGLFVGFSQEDADFQAQSYADNLAAQHQVCLGNIQPLVCVDTDYDQAIVATGEFLSDTQNVWELFGTLPSGLEIPELIFTTGLAGNTIHIQGTPDTAGVYNFTIQVTAPSGDFMSKPYTIRVMEISTASPLPNGAPFVPYSQNINSTAVNNPIFSLESGELPLGLSLDPGGIIFGTPVQVETKDFVLGVTEAGTGITCTKAFELVIFGTNIWDFTLWDAPTISTIAGGTASGIETAHGFDISTSAAPNILSIGEYTVNSFNDSPYSGPMVNANLKLVITTDALDFAHFNVGVSIFQNNELALILNIPTQFLAPGTHNFPFVVLASPGTDFNISIDVRSDATADGAGSSAHVVGTLTST